MLIVECPTFFLHEICSEVHKFSGKSVSESTVCHVLRRHGLTRKKVRMVALQICQYLRAMFMAEVLLCNRDLSVTYHEKTKHNALNINFELKRPLPTTNYCSRKFEVSSPCRRGDISKNTPG